MTSLLSRGDHLVVVVCLFVLNQLNNCDVTTTKRKKQDNTVDDDSILFLP